MDKLRHHLRGDGESVARRPERVPPRPHSGIVQMARHFVRHQQARIEPMRHTRPSSISSYHSSRSSSGRSIRPRSSGERSNTLTPVFRAFSRRAMRTSRSNSANSSGGQMGNGFFDFGERTDSCRMQLSRGASIFRAGSSRGCRRFRLGGSAGQFAAGGGALRGSDPVRVHDECMIRRKRAKFTERLRLAASVKALGSASRQKVRPLVFLVFAQL